MVNTMEQDLISDIPQNILKLYIGILKYNMKVDIIYNPSLYDDSYLIYLPPPSYNAYLFVGASAMKGNQKCIII
jgi:hypothetical protein